LSRILFGSDSVGQLSDLTGYVVADEAHAFDTFDAVLGGFVGVPIIDWRAVDGLNLGFSWGCSACRALMLGASGDVVCDSACRGVVRVVHVVHWAGGHRRGWQASGVSAE
jgi:hypothetical protein